VAGGCGDDDLVRAGVEAAVDEFDGPAGHFADQVAIGDYLDESAGHRLMTTSCRCGAHVGVVGACATRRTLTCL
jgi:hypothetical protein